MIVIRWGWRVTSIRNQGFRREAKDNRAYDSIGNPCGMNSLYSLFKKICLPLPQADRSLPP
jgi:hypothetical protein